MKIKKVKSMLYACLTLLFGVVGAAFSQNIDLAADSRYGTADTYNGIYPGTGYDVHIQSGLSITSSVTLGTNTVRWSIASFGYFNIPADLPDQITSNGVTWEKVYYFYDTEDGPSSEVRYENITTIPPDWEGNLSFATKTARTTPGYGQVLLAWNTQVTPIGSANDLNFANNAFYYPITVGSASLPVKLASFTATTEARNVLLNWATTEEVNFERFDVERSLKPQSGFETIGSVPSRSRSGAGYTFTDAQAPTGQPVYYRLKMIDLDGSYAHSQIESVTLEGADVTIYPNPASEILQVSSSDAIRSLELFNVSGNSLGKQVKAGTRKVETLAVQTVASGMYQVKIEHSNGLTLYRKVIISR